MHIVWPMPMFGLCPFFFFLMFNFSKSLATASLIQPLEEYCESWRLLGRCSCSNIVYTVFVVASMLDFCTWCSSPSGPSGYSIDIGKIQPLSPMSHFDPCKLVDIDVMKVSDLIPLK